MLLRGIPYNSKKSVIHKLDPRTKIILIPITVVTVSLLNNYLYLSLFCLTVALFLALSNNIRPLSFLATLCFFGWCFTLIILYLMGCYQEWVISSSKFFFRVFAIACAGLSLAFTTTTNVLFRGMEELKIPRPLILMLVLTYRFIRVLTGISKDVVDALKVRGVQLTISNFLKQPNLFSRGIVIPLIISIVKFSRDTIAALEARAYGNPVRRTSFREIKFHVIDILFICIFLGFSISLLLLEWWYPWTLWL